LINGFVYPKNYKISTYLINFAIEFYTSRPPFFV
jgi:hypothetical protein